jgi:NADH/NAD ratio-sensing transcriptional regulator Rex
MAARAVVKIFKKNKISINSVYDEDLIFKGQKISNIPIKILTKKKLSINKLKKKIFIVCNFDKNTFTNISKRLIKSGLTKNKIFHLYF